MHDARTLEREYLSAMRMSALRLDDARVYLAEMKRVHPDQHRVIVYEAHYAQFESLRNLGSALQRICNEVLDETDVIPSTRAMAYVVATNQAMMLNEVSTMDRLNDEMPSFWAIHAGEADVSVRRAACEHNVGIHYLRNNRYADAIHVFNEMLVHLVVTPENACWLAQIYAHLATVHARLGDIASAERYVALGDEHAMPINEHYVLYAHGEIAIAQSDWSTAKSYFHRAYRTAKALSSSDRFLMAYALVGLARVYKEIGNHECFWLAYEQAHEISRNDGVPHVFGVIAELAIGVPMNV